MGEIARAERLAFEEAKAARSESELAGMATAKASGESARVTRVGSPGIAAAIERARDAHLRAAEHHAHAAELHRHAAESQAEHARRIAQTEPR